MNLFCFMVFVILHIPSIALCLEKNSNEIDEFRPLESATKCVDQAKASLLDPGWQSPNCTFSSVRFNNGFKAECLGPGVLRIQGEYSAIKIKCWANYAIDFFYFGIQPTEAINVTWFKMVQPNSEGKLIIFGIEVVVRSVKALQEYYSKTDSITANNYNDNTEENPELSTPSDYTRTGRYVIQGIFNKSMETSYHIFFEENDTTPPSFLRNSETKATLEGNQLTLPCFSTHYNSKVTAFLISRSNQSISKPIRQRHDKLKGILIPLEEIQSKNAEFKCVLEHGRHRNELYLTYPKETAENDVFIPYGMEELGSTSRGDVEINYESGIDRNFQLQIKPWCRVLDLNEDNTMLTAVPAHNFAHLRLVREFVMPKFVNRSLTVKRGTERRLLERELRVTAMNSLHDRFGVTFCMSGKEHKILEYGTSHKGEVIKINYGLDWTTFDRFKSPVGIFLVLTLENHIPGNALYANVFMTFKCRVHEAVVVQPTIWYTKRKNGSTVEELIDYDWHGPFSYLKKNMTPDITEVMCAGSFWYSTAWRNISMPVNLIEGTLPVIKTNTTKYTFRPNLQHQILNCEVDGNPQPNTSWSFNGFDISSNAVRTEASIILDFPEIRKSHAGIYECIAENQYGITRKKFVVDVEEEPGPNYGIFVGIPVTIVAILGVLTVVYIQRWKKRQIGLTKAEIQEFMEGQVNNTRASALPNQYAHDFAHTAPYTGQHEIPSSKFQIDESSLLGSGQYGVVYKGLLSGSTVAVKTTTKNADNSYLKALLSELKIMIHLGPHQNVVQFLGSNTAGLSKGVVYIFVKYCSMGSLEKFLRSSRQNFGHDVSKDSSYTNSFNYYKLLSWSKQIAAGMCYLGSKKVIHGDLAARNILLTEDLQAQITDFGLSRQLYDYADYVKKNQEPLPWRWLAIESLRDMTFSSQSDVWSYGVTLWEIFSLGQVPYPGLSWTMTFVEDLEKGLRMRKPVHAPDILYELIISECWHVIPEQRPNFKRILELFDKSVTSEGPTTRIYTNQPTRV